ncbi:hypothetical protein ACFW2E_11645, partial [Streptomyces sp. NPDC058964]
MDVNGWFQVEGPAQYGEEPWDFTEAEPSFPTVERARSAAWVGAVGAQPGRAGRGRLVAPRSRLP